MGVIRLGGRDSGFRVADEQFIISQLRVIRSVPLSLGGGLINYPTDARDLGPLDSSYLYVVGSDRESQSAGQSSSYLKVWVILL